MNGVLPRSTQGVYRLSASAFYFLQGLVFATWASRIPDVKASMELDDAALGTVLLAIPVGQMSAMALSGFLVARFGSRRMLLCAAVSYSVSLVSLALVSTVWWLGAVLFFFGVAANLMNISVNTQGVGVERLYGRSIMARFHGLWSLAGFAGGLASMWMAAEGVAPLEHFCLISGVGLLMVLAFYPFLLPRDARLPVVARSGGGVFRRMDAYVGLLGVFAFGSMVSEGTMFDWSGVFFQDVVQPGPELVRLGYVAFMCTMAAGRFLADGLVTRLGAIRVLRGSGVLIGAGLLLAVLFPNVWMATLGFLLVGFGTSSVVPICYSMAGLSRKLAPSVALAAVSTVGFLGFLLGPPMIGYVSQALNLRWSFALIAVVGFGTSLAAPLLRRVSVKR
ncbi:MFS transporter [Akkermansia glycaniphila]|uniref:Major facilitator superfamily n=1 Tax=Akkermansia glycaniphila TaxID=1679444 RepID=A0A1C7P8Q0_9BACT|nr:MFS transporter [Akkermansia glycaniphila]MBT9450552.1 MFS transporter [Akkermansia glycaniphila]OCA01916.1 MFS transporter [Akkermansia glycaniphila]SEH91859.1 major facilitator superfamily [Akkermansia glycaniphila]